MSANVSTTGELKDILNMVLDFAFDMDRFPSYSYSIEKYYQRSSAGNIFLSVIIWHIVKVHLVEVGTLFENPHG